MSMQGEGLSESYYLAFFSLYLTQLHNGVNIIYSVLLVWYVKGLSAMDVITNYFRNITPSKFT